MVLADVLQLCLHVHGWLARNAFVVAKLNTNAFPEQSWDIV